MESIKYGNTVYQVLHCIVFRLVRVSC